MAFNIYSQSSERHPPQFAVFIHIISYSLVLSLPLNDASSCVTSTLLATVEPWAMRMTLRGSQLHFGKFGGQSLGRMKVGDRSEVWRVMVSNSPPSSVAIFSKKTDHYTWKISCNSGRNSKPHLGLGNPR